MARSVTNDLLRTIGLEDKGSKQHFKVVYDLLSKVNFFAVLVTKFLSKRMLIFFFTLAGLRRCC